MEAPVNTKKLDYAGTFTATLCLLHCLALPFAVNLLPGLSLLQNENIHLFLATLVVPIAIYSVQRGFKKHGKISVLISAFVGSILLVAGLLSHHYEVILTVAGGLLLIHAHMSNLKHCSCSRCTEP